MKITYVLLGAALPAALFATTAGGPIGHAAVPSTNTVDNSTAPQQNCQRCHNSFPVNSPGGFVRIDAFHYRPGQKQTIRVTVSHPEAQKWGFQLTARQARDLNAKAGTFSNVTGVRLRCSDTAAGRDVTPEQPCSSDALEFAGHNPQIVFGGENGTKTFEVEWTAPVNDVGDVVFYAVGNAANSTTGNQGDRIYLDNLTVEAEGRSCPNTARPVLQSVTNAASNTRELSWNSLVTVWGRDFTLGTKRTASRADMRPGYPLELGCVAVEVAGRRVPITYVGQDQINIQIPTVSATGSVPVRVILNPDRPNQLVSEVGNINLQSYAPAFFTFNGRSAAAVNNATGALVAAPAVVSSGQPARPGDVLQLYATGLGATDPVWQAGELPGR
ncbi:MAG TPA: choice-of-anchor V domain-containing protein, partial [Bryobacteraceae bacterium]|nr:choice-of-anchor V domain-containing protein [Bryobacteraceae bacterium]